MTAPFLPIVTLRGTALNAARGFTIGYCAGYIFSGMQVAEALAAGCVGALTILVVSVVDPVFQRFMGDNIVGHTFSLVTVLAISSIAVPTISPMLGMAIVTDLYWKSVCRIFIMGASLELLDRGRLF